ncbi:MAG: efflux RND transporter periplasmic adaptor subunit [Colwellia sp.]|jgi:multidrug efflux pump subunit AcrA (membrane-fusion protein)|uniref:efflux RND transporter periplasmic adaptor subunit n=1 Tax=Colwellia sp. Bg11-12 TaxID=2759817 RepID=UPI0015F4E034|nr:efflux RND transporter periplasmic adaptor subunit [Colwellia sp. Bg11-12]MBA6263971.1 efflux RND transporter periplasmic adaptor subunit [Colwellia sp. Bg11-12]
MRYSQQKTLKKTLIVSLLFIAITGCSGQESDPLLYEVTQQEFVVNVPAKGELFAAKATVISAPISRQGPQNISWLAPEFSRVKKGDVIARFDGEAMEIQSKDRRNELSITKQEIIEKTGMLNQALDSISKDIGMVGQEKSFAENFSINDDQIRSKLEILDSLQNTQYLGSKEEYLYWKNDSFSASSAGDMGLLEMKQAQSKSKLKQLSEGLAKLEVKAPHDGLLAYKANWRGEKPREGQSLWPGQKIAELPDISNMKVKLFVLESEAINLAIDKPVSITLNAYSDKPFKGTVETVAPFPTSIKRGDPQKYFEVIVVLTEQNTELFVPGRKLEANIEIIATSKKMVIPLQSVFVEAKQSFVYLYKNGDYISTPVTLGQASLSHVEILSGLKEGQKIALTNKEHS